MGDLIETDREVDADLEVTGLQKHMDGGCPILFENIKGKPNHRVVTNLFGDMKVINKMFGWKSDEERVKKLAYALSHPLKPEITRRRCSSTSSRTRRRSTTMWCRSGTPPTSPS
jgi:UbiD family decarboxylase